MKKIIKLICIFALLAGVAVFVTGCDSSDYKNATKLYEEQKYSEAIPIFESLGDYEDSAEMLKKCKVGEIDALLQGKWQKDLGNGLISTFVFDSGKVTAEMRIEDSGLKNSGTYRIDIDQSKIFICYDNVGSIDNLVPNTEKKETPLPYSYADGKLVFNEDYEKVS